MAAKANYCCAIELEPRTLSQGQLNHAREMAADAVQKLEQTREVPSILMQGLGEIEHIEEIGIQFHPNNPPIEKINKEVQVIIESPCQCSVEIEESPTPNHDLMNIKEPVTAPF